MPTRIMLPSAVVVCAISAAAICAISLLTGVAPAYGAKSGLFWTVDCLKFACVDDPDADRRTQLRAGAIARANLSGAKADHGLITGAPLPLGIDATDRHLYWTNHRRGTISRARLDGSRVQKRFITGLKGPVDVAVDGGRISWTSVTDGPLGVDTGAAIGSATLAGGRVNKSLIDLGAGYPVDLEATGGHLYVLNDFTHLYLDPATTDFPCGEVVDPIYGVFGVGLAVGRATLDGSLYDECFIAGELPEEEPFLGGWNLTSSGLAVNDRHIYFLTESANVTFGRANLDGSGVNPNAFTLSERYRAVSGWEADANHIYWVSENRKKKHYISRVNVDGSGEEPEFIRSPDLPVGIAALAPGL